MNAPLEVSYLPTTATIVRVAEESADTRTFVLEPADGASQRWRAATPGQFVMLSLLGSGEAALTLSRWQGADPPGQQICLTVRRVGGLTTALFALGAGDAVGVRGPFGRGFPAWPEYSDVLFVAGGCGLAPLRAAIQARVVTRAPAASVTIVYGARAPETRIFRADLDRWRATSHVTVLDGVERPDSAWRGRVGSVMELMDEVPGDVRPAAVAVCGPQAMMVAVARRLARAGIRADRIWLAIERQMKCGVGLCGRCYIGHRLVCTHGPVFSLDELLLLDPAFGDASEAPGLGPET
jgi:NAD(P)H-flavin reductase